MKEEEDEVGWEEKEEEEARRRRRSGQRRGWWQPWGEEWRWGKERGRREGFNTLPTNAVASLNTHVGKTLARQCCSFGSFVSRGEMQENKWVGMGSS